MFNVNPADLSDSDVIEMVMFTKEIALNKHVTPAARLSALQINLQLIDEAVRRGLPPPSPTTNIKVEMLRFAFRNLNGGSDSLTPAEHQRAFTMFRDALRKIDAA